MEDISSIKNKQEYLRAKTRNRKLVFSFHNREMSFLEGVLSRGDRRLSQVIYLAFKKGCRFDAWSNYFCFEKWEAAFKEADINPELYLQEKTENELLAWDFIDLGVNKQALIEDFKKLVAM